MRSKSDDAWPKPDHAWQMAAQCAKLAQDADETDERRQDARPLDHGGKNTPTIVDATAFKSGIVVAQVNKVVEKLPRVDIPGDQVDFVVERIGRSTSNL